MAGTGATVGGANVRITPDTRKFAGELRKKLQEIESRIAMRLRVMPGSFAHGVLIKFFEHCSV